MAELLDRITVNPTIFGGKPIIRGHRLAVEHVLAMLAAGDDIDTILAGYAWNRGSLPPHEAAPRFVCLGWRPRHHRR
jgi:hypothetical protein